MLKPKSDLRSKLLVRYVATMETLEPSIPQSGQVPPDHMKIPCVVHVSFNGHYGADIVQILLPR